MLSALVTGCVNFSYELTGGSDKRSPWMAAQACIHMKKGFLSQARERVWVSTNGPLDGHMGEIIGKVPPDKVKVIVAAESDSDNYRTLLSSQCHRVMYPQGGDERLMSLGSAREPTLRRLLGGIAWPDGTAEAQNLHPEMTHHILSFLAVLRVDPAEVMATGCSSIDDHNPNACALHHALTPAVDNWWISGPGSMGCGVGGEWVAFRMNTGGEVRRIERVDMRIPPLPAGPLSVRNFYLESAPSAEGPWTRASPEQEMTTLDATAVQSWALRPPIEAAYVRVVCTRNAARARADRVRGRLAHQGADEENEDDYETSLGRLPACVGFFYVAFA